MSRPEELFVIWSEAHSAYLRPKGLGFTLDLLSAGVYTRSDAETRTAKMRRETIISMADALFLRTTTLNTVGERISRRLIGLMFGGHA